MRKRGKYDLWTRLGRIAGALVLCTVVTGAVWWVHQPLLELSHFQVSDIQVQGNSHVTPEEVRSQLVLQAPVNVFQLDLEELAGRIMAHPWIRNASIQRRLPLGLIVTVEERQPVGLLFTGKPYLLSADGFILEEVKGPLPQALPRIRPVRRVTGRVGQHLDDPHLLGGLELLGALQEARVLRQLQVEQVAVEADGNYTLRLAQGRPILRVGPAEPLRQLIRLDTALRHRGQKLESFAYVDLRFPGRVILKPWRKEGKKWGGRTT